jgi:uncharacterized membrane protein
MRGADQDPMADPNVTLALFTTRWITHFCAPVFVVLAGISVGLMVRRRSRGDIARLLITRGIWLLFIEVAVLSTAATFSPFGIPELGGHTLVIMQVIWVIGVSMILLAGLQWLGRPACLAIGAAVILRHNLLDRFWPASGPLDPAPLWVALHAQMSHVVGPFLVVFIYPLVPWPGVMLLGFGASRVFELEPARRKTVLLTSGAAMTAAFVILRALWGYGDPNGWQAQPAGVTSTAIDFFNTTKYPPSLLFLLMTLGPAALFAAVADRIAPPIRDVLSTYGRAPFAFYVPHFFVIHLLSIALGLWQGFALSQLLTVFLFYPKGYGLPLPLVYVVWIVVVASLYPLCRWVSALKSRRTDWWLSYV